METQSRDHTSTSSQRDSQESRLILVVDDDPEVCRFISEALSGEGYRTVIAADGEQALRALADCKPDLILLDVQMPHMDGWRVLEQLRVQAGPHQPIVVMTGRYEGQDRALSTGAQGYLAKPFDLQDLLDCVDLHSGIKMESNTERMHGRD